MKNIKLLALIPFILIIGIVGISIWFMLKPKEHYIQGQIEAKQISVAPKIPGRVDKIVIHEGDNIKKGDLLLSIATPEIDAKLSQANAAKQAALAQLEKANHGARKQQIEAAHSLYMQAKTAVEFAKTSYERVESLYKDNLVPAQKRDEVLTKYNVAVEQMNAAKSQYDLALEGAQMEDKEAAKALVDRAQGAVDEVKIYQEEASLYAPSDGEVQKIVPNQGELVNTGYPVVTIVDLSDIWAVVNIREDIYQKYEKGTKFVAIVPALSNKEVEFEVRSVSVMADFATWTATKAQGDFDRKTFEIKAYPTQKIEGLRPGMSILIKQ